MRNSVAKGKRGQKGKRGYSTFPLLEAIEANKIEAGHLMKLDDKYKDTARGSIAVPGWEGNIMAEHGGKVSGENIDEVIKANKAVKAKEPCIVTSE